MRTSGIIIVAAAAVANAHYGEEPVVYPTPSASSVSTEVNHPSYSTTNGGGFTTIYTHPVYPNTNSTTVKPTQYTTSTVYTTKTYTITKCPPTVTDCPVGHVTTETIPVYTTVCPVETGKPVEPKPHETKPVEPKPNPTEPGKPHEPLPTNPADCITKTQTYVYPHPTQPGQSITKTITYTIPKEPSHNATAVNPPPHHTYNPPTPTGGAPIHPNGTKPEYPGSHGGKDVNGGKPGSDEGTGSSTPDKEAERLPSGPTSEDEPETVTSGAAMTTVTGLLAIVGFAAAYLI
ncbi:hypothetical protein CEP53_012590 [Fusarium sp. AF-6]|nr:hypothetical protein CEP53_012590 [Fusarium sp. AF-6]